MKKTRLLLTEHQLYWLKVILENGYGQGDIEDGQPSEVRRIIRQVMAKVDAL